MWNANVGESKEPRDVARAEFDQDIHIAFRPEIVSKDGPENARRVTLFARQKARMFSSGMFRGSVGITGEL